MHITGPENTTNNFVNYTLTTQIILFYIFNKVILITYTKFIYLLFKKINQNLRYQLIIIDNLQ